MFIVFDLDDTLADNSHRHHLIEYPQWWAEDGKPDWDAFFELCDKDALCRPDCRDL